MDELFVVPLFRPVAGFAGPRWAPELARRGRSWAFETCPPLLFRIWFSDLKPSLTCVWGGSDGLLDLEAANPAEALVSGLMFTPSPMSRASRWLPAFDRRNLSSACSARALFSSFASRCWSGERSDAHSFLGGCAADTCLFTGCAENGVSCATLVVAGSASCWVECRATGWGGGGWVFEGAEKRRGEVGPLEVDG